MQDRQTFNPEQLEMIDCKILEAHLEIPEALDARNINGNHLDYSFQLGFNVKDNLGKADLTVHIKTESGEEINEEASAHFRIIFVYSIPQLDSLAHYDEQNALHINPILANALASVSYSTARGILISKVQGTVFQSFKLPIVNPDKLVHKQ